jgi:hypothetical protein
VDGSGVADPISGRAANGVVREHGVSDALAAAASSRPGGGTMDDALAHVPNVPAMGTPEAARYTASGGGSASIPDDITPGSSIAGYEIRAPLRNMRPPHHIMERARYLQEQRRQQRMAEQAAGAQPPAPTPAPQSGQPRPRLRFGLHPQNRPPA